MAEQLFDQALPAVTGFTSPRAWAFSLIGIHEYLRRTKGDRVALEVREDLTGPGGGPKIASRPIGASSIVT